MLKLSLISLAFHLVLPMNGNTQPIMLAEPEKIEIENVVVADSLQKQLLFQNAMKWIKTLGQYDEKFALKLKDSIDGKLYGQSSFFVYAQTGILKKISGVISYHLSIEVKDNKYRYQFYNFTFHYYKMDRYYNMVETGKTKPLEESNAAGWQKLWASHRAFTMNKMKENSKLLELKMAEDPKKTQKLIAKKVEW